MRLRRRPGGAHEPGGPAVMIALRMRAAGRDASRPRVSGALLERLAAVEAGIRDNRHRQPPEVVEAIARLRAAGESVAGISAGAGVSPHIVRDRLHRAGALECLFRNQHRHVQDVIGRRGPGPTTGAGR